MSSDRTRRDLALGFGSQFAFKALGFLILALLARNLAREDYGRLMFALALCTTTVLLTDLGVSMDLVRRVAARPHAALRRVSAALSARLPLVAVYFVAINAWVALTKPDLLPVTAGIAAYVATKDLYRTHASLFLGLHRVASTIFAFGSGLFILAIGVVLGATLDRSLGWMVGCYVLSGMVTLTLASRITRGTVGPLRLRFKLRFLRLELGRSVLLFALTTLSLVHFSADTLMLGYLRPYEEVATYEAAARLLEASQFLMRPLTMILFPVCTQLATAGQWVELRRLLHRMFTGVSAVGLAATGVVALLADTIVRIVYTSVYDDSAPVLRVLYLSVPGLYAASVGGFLAAAMHRERRAVGAMAAGVGLNVLLNVWAIPRYGPMGAAWTTVATQTFVGLWLSIEAYCAIARCRAQDAIQEHSLKTSEQT